MASVFFTSLSSLRAHHARGAVVWGCGVVARPGILLGAVVGSALATVCPVTGQTAPYAVRLYLLLIAAQMFFRNKSAAAVAANRPRRNGGRRSLIGAVSGMVGFGEGIASIPLLSWSGVQFRQAIGTAAAIALPIAFSATAGYVAFGFLSDAAALQSRLRVSAGARGDRRAQHAACAGRCALRAPTSRADPQRALALVLLIAAARLAMAH